MPNGTRHSQNPLIFSPLHERSTPREENAIEIRILLIVEDDHRTYRETIGVGIQALRSNARVESVGPQSFDEAVERLDPQLVISTGPDTGEGIAWMELSLDPARPTRIRVCDRRYARNNPTLQALLSVVDEAEAAMRAKCGPDQQQQSQST